MMHNEIDWPAMALITGSRVFDQPVGRCREVQHQPSSMLATPLNDRRQGRRLLLGWSVPIRIH